MIVAILGLQGSGKTMLMTRTASTYDTIICNYKLYEEYFPGKEIFYCKDVEDFFNFGLMDVSAERARGEWIYTPIMPEGISYPLKYQYIKYTYVEHFYFWLKFKKKEIIPGGELLTATGQATPLMLLTPNRERDGVIKMKVLITDANGKEVEVATEKKVIKPKRVILAVDEAVLFFNKAKKMPDAFTYLFSQARKLGIDFYFTAQTIKGVNLLLRENVMYSYDMSHIGSMFAFTVFDRTFIRKKGHVQWRGTFFAKTLDHLRYDTDERLAGAEWYLKATEKLKLEAGKILLSTDPEQKLVLKKEKKEK